MKLFITLGNQLFPLKNLDRFKKDHIFFMAEDNGLCTYEKHHKQKILLFLSSMRSYADSLKKNKFKLEYSKIEDKEFSEDYLKKLKKIITQKKIKEVSSFEIEDKPFEQKISMFFKKEKIEWNILQTPMFLNSREEFKKYLGNSKKPFMATFYKEVRKKSGILMGSDGNPVGGKWSFDEDNRNKLPKDISIPKFPKIKETNHTKKLKPIIEKLFKDHPGTTKNFWFATEYNDVVKLLNFFIKEKSNLFGDYEDALSSKHDFLFHSALSPIINLGLITPKDVIEEVNKSKDIPLNSLEGFIRQIIGWREFIRGVYQKYEDDFTNNNYFYNNRKMKQSWYEGKTGIFPLDDAITKARKFGWNHHIERLMVIANIMNIARINPKEVYKWFMEFYVDSYDWVMVPNVFGMGLYSDGGVFATKPYICASSYILKMSDYKKGEWTDIVDGLYWKFIDENREKLRVNPRIGIMTKMIDTMDKNRKNRIYLAANKFIEEHTI